MNNVIDSQGKLKSIMFWMFPGSFRQSQQAWPTEAQHVHIAQVIQSRDKNVSIDFRNLIFDIFLLSAGLVFWQLCFSAANGFSVSLPFSSPSSHQRSELSSFLFIRWSNNLDFKLAEFSSTCSFQYFGSSILALSVAAACMGHLEKAIWSNPDVRTHILQLTNIYVFFFSIRRKTQRLK